MRHAPLYFVVEGPAVGCQRPRFTRFTNRIYTPSKTREYQKLVKTLAKAAIQGQEMFPGAVCVKIEVQMEPVKSMPKKNRLLALLGKIFPTKKPDLDNVVKSIFDGMNEVVFKDDCQVVDLHASKRYGPGSFVAVTIIDLEEG